MTQLDQLFKRLKSAGYPKTYATQRLLPSWWEPEFAESPEGRWHTEAILARRTGIPIQDLQDPKRPLCPNYGSPSFKKTKNQQGDSVAAATGVAVQLARLASECIERDFAEKELSAEGIRDDILSAGNAFVSLESLASWCWAHGIPVLFVPPESMPKKKGHSKPQGLAVQTASRPAIVLLQNKKQPSWLLFILAHELGHIIRGHLKNEEGLHVDVEVDKNSTDSLEAEANEEALALICGQTRKYTTNSRWLSAEDLAIAARRKSEAHQTDPGHIVLNYGHTTEQWAAANKALSILYPGADAPKALKEMARTQLDLSSVSEDHAEFVEQVLDL